MFLDHFYRPDDDEAVEGSLIADWVEVLKCYAPKDVQDAMLRYLASPDRSSNGRAIRPGPWAICDLVRAARPAPLLVRTPEPELSDDEKRLRGIGLTDEEMAVRKAMAAEILRDAGRAKNVAPSSPEAS